MTTNTDAAREAAAIEIWEFGVRKEIAREYANAAIDTFLSKTLEGADERVAAIREQHLLFERLYRDSGEPRHNSHIDRAELLTLVTALSAKLKAQKAAHAKMLRDEAGKGELPHSSKCVCEDCGCRNSSSSPLVSYSDVGSMLRRLADKIEGGE